MPQEREKRTTCSRAQRRRKRRRITHEETAVHRTAADHGGRHGGRLRVCGKESTLSVRKGGYGQNEGSSNQAPLQELPAQPGQRYSQAHLRDHLRVPLLLDVHYRL